MVQKTTPSALSAAVTISQDDEVYMQEDQLNAALTKVPLYLPAHVDLFETIYGIYKKKQAKDQPTDFDKVQLFAISAGDLFT